MSFPFRDRLETEEDDRWTSTDADSDSQPSSRCSSLSDLLGLRSVGPLIRVPAQGCDCKASWTREAQEFEMTLSQEAAQTEEGWSCSLNGVKTEDDADRNSGISNGSNAFVDTKELVRVSHIA